MTATEIKTQLYDIQSICLKLISDLNELTSKKVDVKTYSFNPQAVISIVCREFGADESLIYSRIRTQELAIARQVAMYLIRSFGRLTADATGKIFSRDHSDVSYACKKVAGYASVDPKFSAKLKAIKEKCGL